ncbi:MAG TPA: FAD-binding oxidoreductase [Pyrinomonadaceae bacterium]|nr:FAD-binding oxidoreductase [Pyrinomonadaceae bacterium]
MNHVESTEISGWGRYPKANALTITSDNPDQVVRSAADSLIARGQGRSYGDAAMLSQGLVMLTASLSRHWSFDRAKGLLTAEAGTTLAEILNSSATVGWFPSVVPGTKYVSLGGAVAADIHGKNHHRDGSFGAHVRELEIILADGERARCSPESRPELFWATIGGMGLTGIITEVTFDLIPVESPYVIVRHSKAVDLNAALALCDSEATDDQYTVAWLDCAARPRTLGRGVFMSGHHASVNELPEKLRHARIRKHREHKLRSDFPGWLLNSFTVGAFNQMYYQLQGSRSAPFACDYESFFFPLDRIANWNRMYGKRGFVQYQCVLPLSEAEKGLELLLAELARSERSSYLAVLKRFGPQGNGLLSFPMEGYTLTMDFPVSDAALFPFLDRLDRIVLEHEGRVYLAKDARLRPEVFSHMYPRLDEWLLFKSKIDPNNRFDSDLARRLGLRAATVSSKSESLAAVPEFPS